jgi:hypothetical protein
MPKMVAALAVLFVGGLAVSSFPGAPAAAQPNAGSIEPAAGTWKTFVLSPQSELRLPPPPDAGATAAEIRELQALKTQRKANVLDQISYWDAGAPGYRWNEIAMSWGLERGIGLGAYRLMPLLNVAIYDATIAAWDSKYTFNRPRPVEIDPSLAPAVATPNSPSYPSEHAAAAGAAAAILGYVMPQDAQFFADKAEEAARSRVSAGVQYPMSGRGWSSAAQSPPASSSAPRPMASMPSGTVRCRPDPGIGSAPIPTSLSPAPGRRGSSPGTASPVSVRRRPMIPRR